MRNIKEFAKTTPTYIYNISDASSAGLELDAMNIGMAIRLGENTYYVLPTRGSYNIFDFTEVPAENLWASDTYCWHQDGTNRFVVTVPLWRLPSSELVTEGSYQIFLFRQDAYSNAITWPPDDETGETRTTPTVYPAHNVVIDYGGFSILDRIAPPIAGEAKRGTTLAFI